MEIKNYLGQAVYSDDSKSTQKSFISALKKGVTLKMVDVREIDIGYSFFKKVNLIECNLTGANLQNAFLYESNINGNTFYLANLEKAVFFYSDYHIALFVERI